MIDLVGHYVAAIFAFLAALVIVGVVLVLVVLYGFVLWAWGVRLWEILTGRKYDDDPETDNKSSPP